MLKVLFVLFAYGFMYLPYTLQDNKMSSSAFIGKGLRKEEFMETQKEIKPISSDS